MRRSAVLEGEHVVAGVIVGAVERALAVLQLAPCAQRGHCDPVNRYRLVGVMGLAAGLVPRAATDDCPVVVDSDLAGIEVNCRPLETTDLTAPNPGGEFEQEERREPVPLHRHQEGLDLVRLPHGAPLARAFGRLVVAGWVVRDVLPRDGVNEGPVDHCMNVAHRFGRKTRGQLLRNDPRLVPANRRTRRVDRRAACLGNLKRLWVFAVGDVSRPVREHLAVAVALYPPLGEQRGVELQQLRLVEPLKPLLSDPGNDVRVGIVLPVLPGGRVK